MAFDKKLLADAIVTRLIEAQSIYNLCNRAFDGLVQQGATSVDVPKLPTLVVKTTGTSATHADRKGTKTDTTMVNVPLGKAAVPIKDEILGRFESNGMLLQKFIDSAGLHLQEYFDQEVITEAQTTTQASDFAGGSLAWQDIVAINKKFNQNKVPRAGRIIIIDANLEDEFWDIDVVKTATAYQQQILATGKMITLLGMQFFISGLVPTVGGKFNIVGIYGEGLAFVLSKFMEVGTNWDGENLQWNNDALAHYGKKLFDNKFAVVKTKP